MIGPDNHALNMERQREAQAERDRLLIRLRQSSPQRSTRDQADAGHLPLFIAANEPTLF